MELDRCRHGVCEEVYGVDDDVSFERSGEEGYKDPSTLAGLKVCAW